MKKAALISFILILHCLTKAQTISFVQAPGSPISNASNQRGYFPADLNNDGIVDLVVGNAYNTNLYVYIGLGTGQFSLAPGSPITSVNGPISNVVSDFNNDNIPDLATANYNSGNVSVFLGVGNGSFSPAAGSPVATGTQPYYLEAADFNMDGNKDIIMVNAGSNNIVLLTGNGAGSFTLAPGFPITANVLPFHVSAGHFNADNFPDFAVASGQGNTVHVYLNNGAGAFTPAPGSPYATGSLPRTIAVGDLNNDGFSDMAIASFNSNNMHIYLGSATGLFTNAPGSPINVGSGPYQCVMADFNLNGSLDIAVANWGSSNVSVFYGNGTGSFTQATGSPMSVGNGPQPMCAADFNGNTVPDLAVGDWSGNKINILINTLPVPCNLVAMFNYTASTPNVNF